MRKFLKLIVISAAISLLSNIATLHLTGSIIMDNGITSMKMDIWLPIHG